ncbi:MAG: hypothetical protein B0W54_03080 [Cellvibrio sp. 79]|nr:MAG: hypothetical protein B0W54_03080 [Cellvibrio sp. 79]
MPVLLELLTEFQASALGVVVRSSGGWGYAVINLFHLIGVAILAGSVLLLDLRLLGWRRHIPLDNVTTLTLPLAVFGFLLALITGICLLSANASDYANNPFLAIKFLGLLLALANAWWASHLSAWKNRKLSEPVGHGKIALALAGFISLISWGVVVTAGRLIGYW